MTIEKSISISSPDVASVLRHHGLTGFASPCLLELWHVLHHAVYAVLARRIELASLIVEAVREFVTDAEPDAPEVDGVVHIFVEERRLQNARRKNNFVIRPAVIGVHFRR